MKKNTIGYVSEALNKIRNSDDHGFSPKEVLRLLKLEKEFTRNSISDSSSIIKLGNKISEGFSAMFILSRIYGDPILKSLLSFSEKGWHISPFALRNLTLSKLSYLLSQEDYSDLEDLILNDSNKIVKTTIEEATTLFPLRKSILEEIKICYEKELYFAVINLCYSQVDGICKETWHIGFFDKDKNDDYKLQISKKLNQHETGIANIIAKQLEYKENEITIYSEDFKKKHPKLVFKSINRHLILHGHSYNYGSKINAMRAILLIDFILYFVKEKNRIESQPFE
jgi:hypothetical protein